MYNITHHRTKQPHRLAQSGTATSNTAHRSTMRNAQRCPTMHNDTQPLTAMLNNAHPLMHSKPTPEIPWQRWCGTPVCAGLHGWPLIIGLGMDVAGCRWMSLDVTEYRMAMHVVGTHFHNLHCCTFLSTESSGMASGQCTAAHNNVVEY